MSVVGRTRVGTALMAAVTLAPLAAGDSQRYAALAGVLALLVGLWCLLGALMRLGVLGEVTGYPAHIIGI
ncbi:hypothetical protein ACGFQG_31370 [Nocardia fluminea]|uniref:hypothetical protein n=1 Tax=Nocardia fluminea TaxID=134984 RepID=UPI003713877C